MAKKTVLALFVSRKHPAIVYGPRHRMLEFRRGKDYVVWMRANGGATIYHLGWDDKKWHQTTYRKVVMSSLFKDSTIFDQRIAANA